MQAFLDVTTSARVDNLWKGHAVCFADLNNDGNEDIYIKMGGAYTGDAYENALHLNSGENNNNHWVKSYVRRNGFKQSGNWYKNKSNINDNGTERSVYRDVNSAEFWRKILCGNILVLTRQQQLKSLK